MSPSGSDALAQVREVRTGTVVWTSGALSGATAPFYLVVRPQKLFIV
jgi:hypothetical protein